MAADTDPELTFEVARHQTEARAAEIAALIESARRVFRDGIQEILGATPDWSPPPPTSIPSLANRSDDPPA